MAQAVVPPRLTAHLSTWGAEPDEIEAAASALVARYGESHRRYHNLEHIDEMLIVTDRLGATDEVLGAVWFHDAIYDPPRSGNEERSAAYAREVLGSLGAPSAYVEEVVRLVLSTVDHAPDPDDVNGTVLADADLAILGAPQDRYACYVRDVRAEYGHVTDDAWRDGRGAVLRGFLARQRLYFDDTLRDELEPPARDNLRAELAALSAP